MLHVTGNVLNAQTLLGKVRHAYDERLEHNDQNSKQATRVRTVTVDITDEKLLITTA